jgi:hypothetical protein
MFVVVVVYFVINSVQKLLDTPLYMQLGLFAHLTVQLNVKWPYRYTVTTTYWHFLWTGKYKYPNKRYKLTSHQLPFKETEVKVFKLHHPED